MGRLIHASDYQIRHSMRNVKTDRGASLSFSDISNIPDKLNASKWFYDSRHNNVIAAFPLKGTDKFGKVIITIGYGRGGVKYNAINTSGVVNEFNLKHPAIKEINPPKS
jgi:hypothetical protein